MKFLMMFYICFFLFVYKLGANADSNISSGMILALSSERLNPGQCLSFKVISLRQESNNQDILFVFKTSPGLIIFADNKCKNSTSGIDSIREGDQSTYYFTVSSIGKFTIAIYGLGKFKFKIEKTLVASGLKELEKNSKIQQEQNVKTYREIGKLNDEEVIDLKNLDGEIRQTAYNNLKLQLVLSNKYLIYKCNGPINAQIPNIHHIIRGNQFATYLISAGEKTQFYLDEFCKESVSTLKFTRKKPLHSIYFRSSDVKKSFISLVNRGTTFSRGDFMFIENEVKEINDPTPPRIITVLSSDSDPVSTTKNNVSDNCSERENKRGNP